MKASEVIKQLQLGIAQEGDLDVTTEDGLDPSDMCEVREVSVGHYPYFSTDKNGILSEKKLPHFYFST